MDASFHANDEAACCGGCAAAKGMPRQVAWLQGITLGWMALECAASLAAAARAHSVALLAFGSDSLIELLSATVVMLQFMPWLSSKKNLGGAGGGAFAFSAVWGGGVHCRIGLWESGENELAGHGRDGSGAGGDAGAGGIETERGAADRQSRAGGGCDPVGCVRLPGRGYAVRIDCVCGLARGVGGYGGGAGCRACVGGGGMADLAWRRMRMRVEIRTDR